MMKDGAVSDPMLPRKLAMEERNCAHVCLSAGGISSSDSGISGVFTLLDMLRQKQWLWVGGKCLLGEGNDLVVLFGIIGIRSRLGSDRIPLIGDWLISPLPHSKTQNRNNSQGVSEGTLVYIQNMAGLAMIHPRMSPHSPIG